MNFVIVKEVKAHQGDPSDWFPELELLELVSFAIMEFEHLTKELVQL